MRALTSDRSVSSVLLGQPEAVLQNSSHLCLPLIGLQWYESDLAAFLQCHYGPPGPVEGEVRVGCEEEGE